MKSLTGWIVPTSMAVVIQAKTKAKTKAKNNSQNLSDYSKMAYSTLPKETMSLTIYHSVQIEIIVALKIQRGKEHREVVHKLGMREPSNSQDSLECIPCGFANTIV